MLRISSPRKSRSHARSSALLTAVHAVDRDRPPTARGWSLRCGVLLLEAGDRTLDFAGDLSNSWPPAGVCPARGCPSNVCRGARDGLAARIVAPDTARCKTLRF